MANRSIRLPESLDDDLVDEADAADKTVSEYIRDILRNRDQIDSDDRVDELEQRLDDVEARLSTLEAEDHGHAGAPETGATRDDQSPTREQESPQRAVSASQHTPDAGGGERAERGVVVKADSLRAEAEEVLEAADISGSSAVQRNRREAALWAWDYLREQGECQAGEIANATFGAFWDVQLNYSTSSRGRAGRTLWQNCLRELLKKLPGVEQPDGRGGTWKFVEGDDYSSGS